MDKAPETWICKKCGVLTPDKFYVCKHGSGVRIRCITCTRDHGRERREKDPHLSGKYSAIWRKNNPEQWKKHHDAYYQRHQNEVLDAQKQIRLERRLTVLRHYSNSDHPYCSSCGENILRFLVIDHIDGKGNEHRKTIKRKSDSFYRWLIENRFPSGFRVLCHNCNHSFSIYGFSPPKSYADFIAPTIEYLKTPVPVNDLEYRPAWMNSLAPARLRLKKRLDCLYHYSVNNDPRCACCGLSNYEYLVIDHIDGGGCKHRKENKLNGRLIYHWLIQNNFPPGFRILCFNCNFSFGAHGNCAHIK